METLKDILGLPANATEREVRLAAENARLAEEWTMADDDRARAFVKARPLIIAARGRHGARGAAGGSIAEQRACWTCRFAPTLDSCERRTYTRVMAAWIRYNIDDNLHPLPTARDCPGYEDKP